MGTAFQFERGFDAAHGRCTRDAGLGMNSKLTSPR